MVVNDAQVEAVLFGEHGAAAALPAGATVVLSSTVPAGFVRGLAARLGERGLHLLDAPVSGGAVAAEKGELTIMASGNPEAFAAADPALEACARKVYRLGDAPGIGSSVKAVNQLLAGVNLVTAAEGMAFGTALGADPKVLYEVIRNAAGGSGCSTTGCRTCWTTITGRAARATSGSRTWAWCSASAGTCACRCPWPLPPFRW